MCFPRTGDTVRVPDPSELIAAVLTAWAIAWLMQTLTIPAVPTALVALLVFAMVSGTYRRRWALPGDGRHPEPGS